MKDRITAGLIAGITAGIAMNIVDWAGYGLRLHNERLLNWAAVAIFGRLPGNTTEVIFAQLGQILFAGFMGILFAVVLLKLTSGSYLVKGWVFGVIVWFGLYAISIALTLPHLSTHAFYAVLSHLISASVYGLVLAYGLNVLDQRSLI